MSNMLKPNSGSISEQVQLPLKTVKSDSGTDEELELQATQEVNEEDRARNCEIWSRRTIKTAKIGVIIQEYRVSKDCSTKCKTEISQKNVEKNRYNAILCADHNRVILKNRDSANDYIHASWMDMPSGFRFISTQGPLKLTCADFWHMIFTEQCNDMDKCSKYFDAEQEKEYGEYKVKVKEKSIEMFGTAKYTVLEVMKNEIKLTVNHYWYVGWHDQIAPLDPCPMIKMYKSIMEKSQSRPVVVHCSAGVGRTATFVGIHLGCEMIKEDSSVELTEILKCLRTMRLGAIQSQLQYVFMYACLIQLFVEDKLYKSDGEFENFLKKYAILTKRVTDRVIEEEQKKKILKKKSAVKQEKKEKKRELKQPLCVSASVVFKLSEREKLEPPKLKKVAGNRSKASKLDKGLISVEERCDNNKKNTKKKKKPLNLFGW